MSLHDAIVALSPLHYWTFATAANQLTVNDTVGTLNFSSAVNDGGGVTGPEQGTTAQRLFSDQIWTTPGLNANAWTSATWLMLATVPANGAPTTYTDVLGWGDPNNRPARGFRVLQQSGSAQTASWRAMTQTAQAVSSAVQWPQNQWHLIAWQYNTASPYLGISIDGNAFTTTTTVLGPAPINTDQLWIQSQSPAAIAHLAAFNYQVSPTQLLTIANQIQNWMVQIPINIPVTTAAPTVDLTPVLDNQSTFMPQIVDIQNKTTTIVGQTTTIQGQTTTIQTDTHNMVNSLFPQLAGMLQAIMDGITSSISGAAGAITRTIGQIFSGKTWDLLGLYDLGVVCAPNSLVRDLGGGTFFGLQMNATAVADWYVFTGPGDSYTTQSLGTLTIYRGGNMILRTGLHSTTHTLYPLPGVPLFEMVTEMPTIPGDYQVVLTPAPEVCWHLYALQFP